MKRNLMESATLTKAFIALLPACMLLYGSILQYLRGQKTTSSLLQLFGAGCLVVVVLTHIFEALRIMPWMGWRMEDSVGHYLDIYSAVLTLTLFPTGYLVQALAKRQG